MVEPQREVTLTFMAEPGSANFSGKVHGGSVMKWLDHAGYACAVGWSQRYCVTVNVGGIRFLRPIVVGSLVRVNAKVIHTGRTSMHIVLDVSATDPKHIDYQSTTRCIMVFVATGDDGAPVSVPKWVPESEDDRVLQESAMKLMTAQQEVVSEIQPIIDATYE